MRSVDAFEAEHANIPLLDILDEMRDRGRAEIDRRQVEHYGLTNKEIRRTRKRCVDLFEPNYDRYCGGENERDIGADAETNELTCRFDAGIHDARLAFCYRM